MGGEIEWALPCSSCKGGGCVFFRFSIANLYLSHEGAGRIARSSIEYKMRICYRMVSEGQDKSMPLAMVTGPSLRRHEAALDHSDALSCPVHQLEAKFVRGATGVSVQVKIPCLIMIATLTRCVVDGHKYVSYHNSEAALATFSFASSGFSVNARRTLDLILISSILMGDKLRFFKIVANLYQKEREMESHEA